MKMGQVKAIPDTTVESQSEQNIEGQVKAIRDTTVESQSEQNIEGQVKPIRDTTGESQSEQNIEGQVIPISSSSGTGGGKPQSNVSRGDEVNTAPSSSGTGGGKPQSNVSRGDEVKTAPSSSGTGGGKPQSNVSPGGKVKTAPIDMQGWKKKIAQMIDNAEATAKTKLENLSKGDEKKIKGLADKIEKTKKSSFKSFKYTGDASASVLSSKYSAVTAGVNGYDFQVMVVGIVADGAFEMGTIVQSGLVGKSKSKYKSYREVFLKETVKGLVEKDGSIHGDWKSEVENSMFNILTQTAKVENLN